MLMRKAPTLLWGGVAIIAIFSNVYADETDPGVLSVATALSQEKANITDRYETQAREWSKRYQVAYSRLLEGKGSIPPALRTEFNQNATSERKELSELQTRGDLKVREAILEAEAERQKRGTMGNSSRSISSDENSNTGEALAPAPTAVTLDGSGIPKELEFNSPAPAQGALPTRLLQK